MSTIEKIRQFLKSQTSDRLFTSRDLLKFGRRSAVDNAVSDLIKQKKIKRVSRGVFSLPERRKPISLLEIATVKAHSFGRKIISDSAALARKIGHINSESTGDYYFCTDGRSSKFRFGDRIIHFRATSLRKFSLGDSPLGQALRGLCFLGARFVNAGIVQFALSGINEELLKELPGQSALLPSWLADKFHGQMEKVVSVRYGTENGNEKPSISETIANYILGPPIFHRNPVAPAA